MKNKAEKIKEKKEVMLQWKKSYIEALIDELKPFGDVLEVGFGHGYASEKIQSFKPKSHTVIEASPELFKKAQTWAKKYPNTQVLEGQWQDILPTLGIFDSIFINNYPIESEMGMMNRIHPEEVKVTSEQAKELLNQLEKEISQLDVKYSDKEIEDFYEKIGRYNKKELPNFFKKLKDYGYITQAQYKEVLKKYPFGENSKEQPSRPMSGDTTFTFLEECLKNHMRKGSRFSCFSNDITTKFEDAQFFENIITNPFLDYNEKMVPIKVPKFSDHYKFDEGLVMVVEKFS